MNIFLGLVLSYFHHLLGGVAGHLFHHLHLHTLHPVQDDAECVILGLASQPPPCSGPTHHAQLLVQVPPDHLELDPGILLLFLFINHVPSP